MDVDKIERSSPLLLRPRVGLEGLDTPFKPFPLLRAYHSHLFQNFASCAAARRLKQHRVAGETPSFAARKPEVLRNMEEMGQNGESRTHSLE